MVIPCTSVMTRLEYQISNESRFYCSRPELLHQPRSEMSVPRHQLYSTISLRILAIILLTSRVTTADYWSALRPPALRPEQPIAPLGSNAYAHLDFCRKSLHGNRSLFGIHDRRKGHRIGHSGLLRCGCDPRPRARQNAGAGRQKRLPDFPVNKIILNGTHTHTGPVMTEGIYEFRRTE